MAEASGQEASKPEAQPAAQAATRPAPKPKKKGKEVADPTRRSLIRFVFGSVFAWIGFCTAATAYFFFPRALFEPSPQFTIGYPSDFPFGVSTKFQQQHRIWVVQGSTGLYVIFARCTHLGCTPDWKEADNKFKCPCHGSGFTTEGVNFEGPAPRPLDRLHVELTPEGQILVDKSRKYGGATLEEALERWKAPGSYLTE